MDNILETGESQAKEISMWAMDMIMAYGPNLVLAILTLIIGMWIINKLVAGVDKAMQGKIEPTLLSFMHSLASIGLKAMLLISVASMIGIETTSFIAVLGAAGLAVELVYASDWFSLTEHYDLVVAADVLYDRDNLVFLDHFTAKSEKVLLGDSRVKNLADTRYKVVGSEVCRTWPDLNEFEEFNTVRIYLSEGL